MAAVGDAAGAPAALLPEKSALARSIVGGFSVLVLDNAPFAMKMTGDPWNMKGLLRRILERDRPALEAGSPSGAARMRIRRPCGAHCPEAAAQSTADARRGAVCKIVSRGRNGCRHDGERWVEDKKAVLVVGAGDATGGAIARRFAREGYLACVTRRNREKLDPLVRAIEAEGGVAHAFGSDARREEAVIELIAHIEREIAPIEVAVFNVGGNVRFDITETTERVYRKVWEMGCYAGFLVGRELAKVMLPRGHGTILFTGATASLRGAAGFAAFAGAKHGLRALAQSMARELGPRGIHVAHIVIDGAIDTAFIQTLFPDRYALKDREGILNPEAIAENYWQIHRQPRSAWTHEIDLRPWIEPW